MSGLPPPQYVPHPQQQQIPQQTGGYVPPMYQGMPAQPQAQPQVFAQAPPPPFAPQGQPMMYAAAPVAGPGPVAGGVYAQPVYGQPASGEHVVLITQQAPIGMFTDGLFDCFNDGTSCLLATFCRPIRWGLSVQRAGLLTLAAGIFVYGLFFWGETVLTWLFQASCSPNRDYCDATTAIYVLIVLAIVFMIARIALGTIYRGKIRAQHQIPGSTMEDCCLHLWCGCCAVAQEARHVDRMTGHLHMPHAHEYQQFHH